MTPSPDSEDLRAIQVPIVGFVNHIAVLGDSDGLRLPTKRVLLAPDTRMAKSCFALLFQQRFNVALSRARDRMYLFHSVTEDMLKPEDLKARVLQHFKNPMPESRGTSKGLLEECDSDFERAVLNRLLKLGYRVTPQVKVGPFSIDLVVDGENDRRLAIELDGDKYHTPDRWADDLGRQRVLERVGWRFWRCWGSSFMLAPEECFSDLVGTLNDVGIKPTSASSEPSHHTEFRVAERFSGLETAVISTIDEETTIQVGDKILVAFNDEPGRQHAIVITGDRTDEALGIYSSDHVVSKRLLGAMVEDEILIPIGQKGRQATILRIVRPD